jgi:hypothetical protein
MISTAGFTSDTGDVGYEQTTDYSERMQQIQLAFIDDPRKAALDADDLVSELLRSFTEELARRRAEFATEPGDGAAPDTERLRQSVRHYRELVDTLSQVADRPAESVPAAADPAVDDLPGGLQGNDLVANDFAGSGLTTDDIAADDLAGNDLAGDDQAQALELPEETTYRVGEHGEPETVDELAEPTELTEPAESTEFPRLPEESERSEELEEPEESAQPEYLSGQREEHEDLPEQTGVPAEPEEQPESSELPTYRR